MTRLFTLFIALLFTAQVFAQDNTKKQLPDPYRGGIAAMTKFFTDSLKVTQAIQDKKATGLVVLKFTADVNGYIRKVIVYYADDLILTEPVITAIQKTNTKWVIPEHYEFYDFVIPFSINYKPSVENKAASQKAMYNFYQQRKPILSYNQVPLNTATLLPAVIINY
jgi:hypothetical protein